MSLDPIALEERNRIVHYLREAANAPHPIEAGERMLSPAGRGLLLFMADQIHQGLHREGSEKPRKDTPAPYGYCPICGGLGRSRQRRPNGNDRCENGHSYASAQAVYNILSP